MAIKKRIQQNREEQFINENLEENLANSNQDIKALEINAPRNYKSYTIHLNEFEYKLLDKISKANDRSMSYTIRDAIKELGKKHKFIY